MSDSVRECDDNLKLLDAFTRPIHGLLFRTWTTATAAAALADRDCAATASVSCKVGCEDHGREVHFVLTCKYLVDRTPSMAAATSWHGLQVRLGVSGTIASATRRITIARNRDLIAPTIT